MSRDRGTGRRTVGMTHPRIVLNDDWRTHTVEGDWIYRWYGPDGRLREIIVPSGTQTDLASVPRIFKVLIDEKDLKQGALPHDLLYQRAGCISAEHFRINGQPCAALWTRRDVDRLFARVMRDAGVPRWKRRVAYLGVRLGGGWSWRRHRRRRRLEAAGVPA